MTCTYYPSNNNNDNKNIEIKLANHGVKVDIFYILEVNVLINL